MDKSWKAFERKIAKRLGTQRTSLSGGNSKITRSDTMHSSLFVECKNIKSVPGYALFKNTLELAKAEGKLPLVVYKQKGVRGDDGELICMRFSDFEALMKQGWEVVQDTP